MPQATCALRDSSEFCSPLNKAPHYQLLLSEIGLSTPEAVSSVDSVEHVLLRRLSPIDLEEVRGTLLEFENASGVRPVLESFRAPFSRTQQTAKTAMLRPGFAPAPGVKVLKGPWPEELGRFHSDGAGRASENAAGDRVGGGARLSPDATARALHHSIYRGPPGRRVDRRGSGASGVFFKFRFSSSSWVSTAASPRMNAKCTRGLAHQRRPGVVRTAHGFGAAHHFACRLALSDAACRHAGSGIDSN